MEKKKYTIDEILMEVDKRKEEKEQEIKNEQHEVKKEQPKSKFTLVKERIATKSSGLKSAIKENKKKVIGIGTIAIAAVMLLSQCGNSKSNDRTPSHPTASTTTVATVDEPVITIVTTTTPETTKEFITTTTTSTPETTTSTTTVATVDEPVITTTSTTTSEIIVTKASTTTPAETTAKQTTVTTTAPITTTSKVTTTTTKPAEEVKVEPIKIKNFDEKVNALEEALEEANIFADNETIENAIRVLHSDFIEHDEFDEITAVEYEAVLSLMASMGSHNTMTFNAKYMDYIPEITEGVYIPVECFPESSQKFVKSFTKLSEDYRRDLNKIPMTMGVDLTEEEYNKLNEKVMKELDKLNIQDNNLYEQKYVELYTSEWTIAYNEKNVNAKSNYSKKATKEYKELYKGVLELVNSKAYEELTPSVKYGVFTNIAGAMTSGMQEKQVVKYKDFQESVESSIDQAREILVIANKKNKSQKATLELIVEDNKVYVKQEREDLNDLAESLEKMHEEGKLLVR